MTNLLSIYEKHSHLTDKNTDHCYISEVYQTLFRDMGDTCRNLLEIGVNKGGSILLWQEYFSYATIHGVDIMEFADISNERIKLFKQDAYDINFVNSLSNNFDIIIDDGPHTMDSMIDCLRYYQPKLTDTGILVIEDIQDINWIEILKNYILPENIQYSKIYDLRTVKQRYDDILLVIDKRGL